MYIYIYVHMYVSIVTVHGYVFTLPAHFRYYTYLGIFSEIIFSEIILQVCVRINKHTFICVYLNMTVQVYGFMLPSHVEYYTYLGIYSGFEF
jgi:hypothetical protein